MSTLFAAALAAAALFGHPSHSVAAPICLPMTGSAAANCASLQPGPARFSPYTDGYCVGNNYVEGLTDEDRNCYDGSLS